MHSFSFGELALIFGIVVVLFGGSRLASVGKSLGEGIANFKKGLNNGAQPDDKQLKASVTPTQTHNIAQVVDVEHKDAPKS
ncbi:Sec-independent protein translocase subunit TatA/TatB [Fluviispira multicolorata]|uniref:Sec-independent protein translocase protein TatA n=1 Tax=Fluviispira multicolorata TaxID=2654512 RepID=A0A833JBX6_9BACT|nr:twin-arginine translocase TatA/TatE family subunit [Fluviispira multicolorata]KAB8029921.1 twin-arginine translocase TatA/TatE family subunit [Fluviispira multicolorata]